MSTGLDCGFGDTDPALAELFPAEDDPAEVAAFEEALTQGPATARPPRLADRGGGFSVGGDRESLRLLDDDVALVHAVAAANPRAIVVVQSGSAVVMTDWLDEVAAVVQAWYGGAQAGPGLADVLLGNVVPSARLPFSIPADEDDLPPFDRDATSFTYDRWHGWWHLRRTGRPPAFPFGFGLSYTTFAIEDVEIRREGEQVVASGIVRNTGGRDGADVVQVYAKLPLDHRPERLVGFTRVEVPAGGSTDFTVAVPFEHLATRDPDIRTWRPPKGAHTFTVGRHANDPGHSTTVELTNEEEHHGR